MFMLNKKLIGAAIALSLGFTGAAHAFSVNTGFSTLGNIGGFDWAPDSALGKNSLKLPLPVLDGNDLIVPGTGKAFTVYSQASLSSYLPNIGSSSISDGNLNDHYQITYVIGFGELGSQFGLDATFAFNPASGTLNSGIPNFFKVYYTDLDLNPTSKINQLAGTCYDGTCAGQKLILDGVIVNDDYTGGGSNSTFGGFHVSGFNAQSIGNINQNGGITTNAGWGAQKTVTGAGSNIVVIDLGVANQQYDFFDGIDLGFTVLSSLASTAFSQATPSRKVAGHTENLPTRNGDGTTADVNPPCTGANPTP
jgi:hypothetical protein